MLLKRFVYYIINSIILFPNITHAGEIFTCITGISYHMGINKKGVLFAAPNKLDTLGAIVSNPGIGLGYDFRSSQKTTLSLFSSIMIFKDCYDKYAFAVGVGPRYRMFLTENISFDIELLLSLYRAKLWNTEQYKHSFRVVPTLGFNYQISNTITSGMKAVYSPKNHKHSSTSFHILFFYGYIGYQL